jgi:hypothetical protein
MPVGEPPVAAQKNKDGFARTELKILALANWLNSV